MATTAMENGVEGMREDATVAREKVLTRSCRGGAEAKEEVLGGRKEG